jgi:hypothetical protein
VVSPGASGGYRRAMAARQMRSTVAALLVAGALLLVACGGSSKGGGVSHAGFVAKADAVCQSIARESKPTNDAIQALINSSGSFTSRLKKSPPLLRKTLALQTSKVKRIERLQRPKGDEARIAQIVAAGKAELGDLRKAIPIAVRGDLADFIDFATDETGHRGKVEQLGVDYGIRDDCFTLPVTLG